MTDLKTLHDANTIATNRYSGIAQSTEPARRLQRCLSHANELHQTSCTVAAEYAAILREAARMLVCMAQMNSATARGAL